MIPKQGFRLTADSLRLLRWLFPITLVLLLASFWSDTVQAQGPAEPATRVVSDDEVNAVAKQLYCPICENTPLDVCPTQACKDWRELIRQQLGQGWTEPQIVDYFVARYGPQVLAEPPPRGFSTLVWILPILALAGGGIFLWRLLRRWQLQPQEMAAAAVERGGNPSGIPSEMLTRIEREVETRY